MFLVGLLALLAALLVLPLALAPSADAFIYWTNAATSCNGKEPGCTGPAAIGRANLDGTGVTQRFIDVGPSYTTLTGVAIDAEHIYWAASCPSWVPCTTGAIGRAELDGTGVDQSFITTGTAAQYPKLGGIAVDANHLYWSEGDRIARANLDGTNVEQSFIPGNSIFGVAVDADHVYWASCCAGANNAGSIGRANLDGTNVDQGFITGTGISTVAVDANHVYWTNCCAGTSSEGDIGRANLDGTETDHNFIDLFGTSPGSNAAAVAVDAAHVYWTAVLAGVHGNVSWIGRANLDGTGVTQFFPAENAPSGPSGLAVDALIDTELAGSARAKKTQKQHGNAIVVKVKVSADERLTAELGRGKIKVNPSYKLKPKQVELTAGETGTLKLKPKKAQAKKIAAALKRGESATGKLTVKLTDLAENSEVAKLSVRLKR
jgi:hypothetical protein